VSLTPSQWFDQFEVWVALRTGWPTDSQWCARHWAPCPCLGANGIGATTELMQYFLNKYASNLKGAAAVNRKMAEIGRLCCDAGDEYMYELWGRWGPSKGRPDVSSTAN
jgi:hypothetical protein